MKSNQNVYAPLLIRAPIGIMFLVTGFSKLMNPDMIISMLGGLGFPLSGFFGWILILSELLFGAAIVVGWKVKYTVWPLVAILLIALMLVTIPSIRSDPMAVIGMFFHIIAIAGLISITLSGPGAWSIEK